MIGSCENVLALQGMKVFRDIKEELVRQGRMLLEVDMDCACFDRLQLRLEIDLIRV